MTKNLLKKLTFGAVILASSLSFGQTATSLVVTSSGAAMGLDGTLETPLVFTVSGIDNANQQTDVANIRLYDSGTAITGAGHLNGATTPHAGFTLTTTVVTSADFTTTVTAPDANGFFTKTYTINKVTPGTAIVSGSNYDLGIRFVKARSVDGHTSADTAPGSLTAEAPNNHIVYNLGTVTAGTLSVATSKIEGASVNAANGEVTVSGAKLDAVYSITGQQVGPNGLASGVYIVKISKGNKQDTIKVIL